MRSTGQIVFIELGENVSFTLLSTYLHLMLMPNHKG